jgi:DNA-binding PadR family transcriptional regulator
MAHSVQLSHTAALILRTISSGHRYGFDLMDVIGLPSGTIYPALRRLERDGLIESEWEQVEVAHVKQRPARKYYTISKAGRAALQDAMGRYPLLRHLVSK